jgi:hypothetical protein
MAGLARNAFRGIMNIYHGRTQAMTTETQPQATCCPPFNPELWQDKTFVWEHKKFLRGRVFTFFYMPLTFGGVMRRLDAQVRQAGATMPDFLCLSDHTSKWNMDVYLAVDKDVPSAENTTLSGTFYSKVYEGPFRDTAKWCEDYQKIVQSNGMKIKKVFMWYTTCPKCAKKHGKNYVVIIAQVK